MARGMAIRWLLVCALGGLVACGEDVESEKDVIVIRDPEVAEQQDPVIPAIPQRIRIEIEEVNFDAEGNDWDNLNGEWVKLVNKGTAPVSMIGFTLSDDANHVYRFGDLMLPVRGEVTIFTGAGGDSAKSLYWGSAAPIWNNGGDVARLKDYDGVLIDEFKW